MKARATPLWIGSLLLFACGGAEEEVASGVEGDGGTAEEAPKPALEIGFPAVPGWQRGGRQDHGGDEGTSVGYLHAGGDIVLSVFVYDGGNATIPAGAASAEIGAEIEDTVQNIYAVQRLGEYKGVHESVRDIVSLGSDAGRIEFLRSTVDILTKDDTELRTYVYLTSVRDHFVKLRTSSTGVEAEDEARRLEPLLQALGESIAAARDA